MSTATNEKEKIFNNEAPSMDMFLNDVILAGLNTQVLRSTGAEIQLMELDENSSVSTGNDFINEKLGALICNDIGNKMYDKIFTNVLSELNKNTDGTVWTNEEMTLFLNKIEAKLSNLDINTVCGYKLVDFMSGSFTEGESNTFIYNKTGFQGGIYYNETTGDYVVVCRGTEFDGGEEQFKDFVKTDICGFGQDEIPEDFKETKKLLDNLLKNGVAKSQIHIVGHSLGGGVAQMLGAMDDYKDIDVTTYNAVGVEHLLNDMQSAGYVLQNNAKNATNINNYVTCNDFVSTIFNIIGNKTIVVDPINKNDSLKNHIQWQIESGGKSDTILTKLISSISYLTSGHGIENFIGN